MTVSTPNKIAARRYNVCERTVRRWVKAGVNIEDPKSVADHVLNSDGHRLATLCAVTEAVMEHNDQAENAFVTGWKSAFSDL